MGDRKQPTPVPPGLVKPEPPPAPPPKWQEPDIIVEWIRDLRAHHVKDTHILQAALLVSLEEVQKLKRRIAELETR